ncbi:hypothetical protein LXL04_038153 [Taraxacum kok-saghyz]
MDTKSGRRTRGVFDCSVIMAILNLQETHRFLNRKIPLLQKHSNFSHGKIRMNSCTRRAQGEDVIKRIVYVSDVYHHV